MKSFPQPLSTKEEQYYLMKYQSGDPTAKDVLIERNLRLVVHIVKRYNSQDRDLDDLISIGTIGLIKAVSTFDTSKGIRLATYASRCIENELLMMIRNQKKQSKEVSIYEPIGTDREGNEINLLDIIEYNEPDIIENLELNSRIKDIYMKLKTVLTEREREIIILRYGLYNGEEITQREIAKNLGISRSYVSRIEKKALEKLKKAIDEEIL